MPLSEWKGQTVARSLSATMSHLPTVCDSRIA